VSVPALGELVHRVMIDGRLVRFATSFRLLLWHPTWFDLALHSTQEACQGVHSKRRARERDIMERYADLIAAGGSILTQNHSAPRVEALAVKGRRIVAAGPYKQVASLRGPQTWCLDLAGRTMLPGIIDAHAHMEREGLKEHRLSLAGLRSIDDILRAIKLAADANGRGDWIVTMPVGDPPYYFGGPGVLAEGRMPNRYELDGAAPENPVYIAGSFNNWGDPPGYSALNSLALQLNGITAHTEPRCPGVEVCKDESGLPTGVIIESNQRPTVEFELLRSVPRFGWQQRFSAIQRSMGMYNAVGTTSVYEGHGSSPETISLYRAMRERGELTVRISLVVSPRWTSVAQASRDLHDLIPYAGGRGLGDDWLRVAGVFIGLSGDRIIREVALDALPDTGWSGFIEHANTWEEYREYVMLAAKLGFRVHTIAARDLNKVLTIWTDADKRFGIKNNRWVIEHISIVNSAEMKVIKELGVHITTIPSKTLWKRGPKLRTFDAKNGNGITPHRTFANERIPIAIGTDNVPYNPFFSLWSAMTRVARNGETVGLDERMAIDEGLPLITREGARLSFEEQEKGMLTPGMLADFVVLDRDLHSTPPGNIKDTKADMTFVNGRLVYER
jgi:predicted amidohydrolase YtcJ